MFFSNVAYATEKKTEQESNFYYQDYNTYNEYLANIKEGENATQTLSIGIDALNNVETEIFDGRKAITVGENEELSIPITIEESGFYNIILDYYPLSSENSKIQFELLVDGELPFHEAQSLSLKRMWKDIEEKEYDSQGNQIRLPSQQTPMWMTTVLKDTTGFSQEPFRFYLAEGTHQITLSVFQNTLALGGISFVSPEEFISYEEYKAADYPEATEVRRVEAENASAKSDRSIVLMNDKTSPVTMPYSGKEIVYNTIGGSNWKTVGEWVEWKVEVPQTGLYTIVTRFKQDTKAGDVSYRALYIDGNIPFQEARELEFGYDGNWQTKALGSQEENYQFHLEKGTHTIRLEVTLGRKSEVIARVSEALTELNAIYTDIVMVTGTEPDLERDYQFEKIIPEVIAYIQEMSAQLKDIEKELEILTGEKGGENSAVIRRLYQAMDDMVKEPETIAKRLKNYASDLSALGTWLNTSREQPLQLDYIMLSNKGHGTPKDRGNIWQWIRYYAGQFIYSFQMDYANVGNMEQDTDNEITVWIASGRDQADIIRQLVNESFTPEKGIGVNVQLVAASALMSATLADVGPDVYIGMVQNQPVDYALRKAVVDLSQFEDIDDVTERFYPESMTSFYLDSGLYALPDTMSYPMLFYRKDIITDLGIAEEDLSTWDSILQKVLPELDMNNFDFGLQTTINNYGNFLYQNGGRFYNEANTASAMNTAESIKAFETMTTMYTDYGIPVSFDFANRFRSGQMPLAVMDFTSYNQLSIFAPEIAGLWSMLPIPGVENEEGEVDNTALCTVTGSVILANSDAVDESWEFLKWWTSEETQTRYASELEAVMGTGARYATANVEAARTVEWDRDIKIAMREQQANLVGMPNIAGGYYTSRHFSFAFRDVVHNNKNLRETISEAATNITNEIVSKRAEFYDTEDQ